MRLPTRPHQLLPLAPLDTLPGVQAFDIELLRRQLLAYIHRGRPGWLQSCSRRAALPGRPLRAAGDRCSRPPGPAAASAAAAAVLRSWSLATMTPR
jgi:hypothetical protein